MSRRLAILMVIIPAYSLLAAGCGGGQASTRRGQQGDRTLISHSEGVKPLWIQECPTHSDHILVFCGEAHRMASDKMAYNEAYADALSKLVRFIGQKVDAKLEKDTQGNYTFQLRGQSEQEVTIRMAWEDEPWTEKLVGVVAWVHASPMPVPVAGFH